ncbi:hypothetical protein [Pseudomonas sp. RIT-To-2]|uniref:hypothetical protein n=1 Tax=Pseudomonas sp. RIT-To-2 TaxID=3462541 RepID=UPI002413063A
MSESLVHADLLVARDAAASLAQHVKAIDLNQDPLVIAAIGDLQVRIEAAEALLQGVAEGSPTVVLQARLAARHAQARARELHLDLTGRVIDAGLPDEPLSTLLRRLGDHHLNLPV